MADKGQNEESIVISFQDNALMPQLFGEHDEHLNKIEEKLRVKTSYRGNIVSITGPAREVYVSEMVLKSIYDKLKNGFDVSLGEVDSVIRMLSDPLQQASGMERISDSVPVQRTPKRPTADQVAQMKGQDVFAKPSTSQGGGRQEEAKLRNKALEEQSGQIKKQESLEFIADMSSVVAAKTTKMSPHERVLDLKKLDEMILERRSKKKPNETVQVSSRPEYSHTEGAMLKTQKKHVTPYSPMQAEYIHALKSGEVTFAAGPSGTGKTFLAVAAAVTAFVEGQVDRIILSRPVVEAGERLGFLPGDLKDKIDPYLRPLYDALYDMLPAEKVIKYVETNQIEIAPLAFMRGRTLRHSFIILDEAQNTTATQMKMFLTRLGEGSRMAITGDSTQTDLPRGERSGFQDALDKLSGIPEISIVRFDEADIVRHALTSKIIKAYEQHEQDNR